jgi:hypothetical protein
MGTIHKLRRPANDNHDYAFSRYVAARLRQHAPNSREWFRELVKLGVELAEADARRMLAMKTQQALASPPRRSASPPPKFRHQPE